MNAVKREKIQSVPGIGGTQDSGLAHDLDGAEDGDSHEPDKCDWAKDSPDFGSPLLLEKENGEDNHQGERYRELRQERLDDGETFRGTEDGDRGRYHSVAIQQGSANEADYRDCRFRVPICFAVQALEHERYQRENSAFAAVVGAHDEDDVLDADDADQRPQYQRQDAVDVDFCRRQSVFGLEAFPQRVQRACPDVAVDDAEREKSEFCETAAARVGFYVSADLRDL